MSAYGRPRYRRPKYPSVQRRGGCWKDYPGLGKRSTFYPYSSVGNTLALASSAGLLACLFFPQLALLRPTLFSLLLQYTRHSPMPSFFLAYVFSEEGPRRIPAIASVFTSWPYRVPRLGPLAPRSRQARRYRPPFYFSFKLCGVFPANVPSFAFVFLRDLAPCLR